MQQPHEHVQRRLRRPWQVAAGRSVSAAAATNGPELPLRGGCHTLLYLRDTRKTHQAQTMTASRHAPHLNTEPSELPLRCWARRARITAPLRVLVRMLATTIAKFLSHQRLHQGLQGLWVKASRLTVPSVPRGHTSTVANKIAVNKGERTTQFTGHGGRRCSCVVAFVAVVGI